MKRNPFIPTIWLGVVLIIMAAVMVIASPRKGDDCKLRTDPTTGQQVIHCCIDHGDMASCQTFPLHLTEPFLALEFAPDGPTLQGLFAEMPSCDLHPYRIHLRLDFLFMLLYIAFLFGILITTARQYRRDTILLIAIFPIAAAVCDFIENFIIFDIIDLAEAGATSGWQELVDRLSIFVWIKWLSLAATGFFLAFYFFRRGRGQTLAAIPLLMMLPAGVAAMFFPPLIMWFVLSVVVMFLILFLHAIFFRDYGPHRRIYF